MKKLKNEKLDLEVRILGWLEELRKALDDISELKEKITFDQLEITTFWEVIDQKCAEKLELRHQVWILGRDLEHWEANVKELRADSERQIDRYNDSGWPTVICLLRRRCCALKPRS